MTHVPQGWAQRWIYREGGGYDSARVVVDEPEYHATRGGVSTVICEIDQGDASDALAAYIVALHNDNLAQQCVEKVDSVCNQLAIAGKAILESIRNSDTFYDEPNICLCNNNLVEFAKTHADHCPGNNMQRALAAYDETHKGAA